MLSSRTKFLLQTLRILGFDQAMKALKLIINEMNIENGFARHDGSHYYYHLVDVTQTLLNFGVRDENIITTALLHDYIEDVKGVTAKMIETLFNKEVATMVDLLTKDKTVNYHDNKKEMQNYLDRIFENEGACLVKTADRIHNFSSMREATSHEHKMKQLSNTKEFFIPFFKRCRNEYVEYSHFFFHAKTIIEPIMFEIEENDRLMKENAKLKEDIDSWRSHI